MSTLAEPARPGRRRRRALRARDTRPDHHRHGDRPAGLLPADRRLAGLGRLAGLERHLRLPDHVRADRRSASRSASTGCSRTARSRRRRSCAASSPSLGSAAIEGPVISWVADHRKHHAFSDRPGDPHSPHVDHGSGWQGALRGLAHAHVGWLFLHTHRGRRTPLRARPDRRPGRERGRPPASSLCVAGGLAAPFLLGWAFGGTLRDGFTGMLWGGAVRVLVLHHVDVLDQLAVPLLRPPPLRHEGRVAQPALARPASRSARRGTTTTTRSRPRPRTACGRWELDPSAWVISGLEKLGLAWDVVRIPPRAAGDQVR